MNAQNLSCDWHSYEVEVLTDNYRASEPRYRKPENVCVVMAMCKRVSGVSG